MTSQNLFAVRFGAGAFLVAAALALAGCAGGAPADPGSSSPAATEAATPSASATPTSTPSAVYKPADASGPARNVPVPVLPEVAKTETKEGAEAFTKYWFSVLSYAYETGDTERLSALSGPDCVFCRGLVDNIETAWSDGKWISGGRIETPAVTAEELAGQPVRVTLQVIQKELVIRNPDGSPYQDATAATNAGSQATAAFAGEGWVITKLSLIR
ncbi:DUF6318 family protein [Arthrobacter sp. MAHUQ-56]